MRIQGGVVAVVLVGFLVGCVPSPPSETESPEPTGTATTPSAVVAPVGESAIPLGCADILEVADVASLGATFDDPIAVAVDENHIAVGLSVSRLQLGALHCVWSSRYGASDFHASIDLWIAPTTDTAVVATAEQTAMGAVTPIEGSADALIACSDSLIATSEDDTLYNSCAVVEHRAGYRLEFDTSGLRSAAGRDPSVTLELLAKVGAAVDAADPARVVEPVAGTTDPAGLCAAAEVLPVLDYLGATGQPSISTDFYYSDVTECRWDGVDQYGNPFSTSVSVLPGGAWAIPRLATGVSTIWVETHPSSDGEFVLGTGDGVAAWRAIGDDLVSISSGSYDVTAGWEAFVEATW